MEFRWTFSHPDVRAELPELEEAVIKAFIATRVTVKHTHSTAALPVRRFNVRGTVGFVLTFFTV